MRPLRRPLFFLGKSKKKYFQLMPPSDRRGVAHASAAPNFWALVSFFWKKVILQRATVQVYAGRWFPFFLFLHFLRLRARCVFPQRGNIYPLGFLGA